MTAFIYMMSNKWHTVLYTGVTTNLPRRVAQHRAHEIPGFTHKYNADRLVYVEEHHDVTFAIAREKRIKKWRRSKKNALVATINPDWIDIAEGWVGEEATVMLPY